jgi:hypothetical protein
MENYHSTRYILVSENKLCHIHGGGGWDKILLFVANNWDEISSGFMDGFRAYHEKK